MINNNKQVVFSTNDIDFLNNFSNIDDAINFCKAQISCFSEEADKLRKIKEKETRRDIEKKLSRRSTGDSIDLETSPIYKYGVLTLYNPILPLASELISTRGINSYERLEDDDAVLSHAARNAGMGLLIGGGLGLGVGYGINGLKGKFGGFTPAIGAGLGLLSGGIYGIHKGKAVAKKRREELLRVLS